MSSDNIGDILTRIRNANCIKDPIVFIPKTKISYRISKILKKEGFIESFKSPSSQELILYLKYKGQNKKPLLTNLQRISRPGRRVYTNSKEVPTILGGLGIILLSTSKGILTDKEARFYKVGGEVLCSIW